MDPPPPYPGNSHSTKESENNKGPPGYQQSLMGHHPDPYMNIGFVSPENVQITYQVRPQKRPKTFLFNILKWSLVVMLMMEFFWTVILLIRTACSPNESKKELANHIDKNVENFQEKLNTSYGIFIATIALCLLVIGAMVFGALRENFCIMASLACFLWISFLASIFQNGIDNGSRFGMIIMGNIATVYAVMLKKKSSVPPSGLVA